MNPRTADSKSGKRDFCDQLVCVLQDCHHLRYILLLEALLGLSGWSYDTCSFLHWDQKFHVRAAAMPRKAITTRSHRRRSTMLRSRSKVYLDIWSWIVMFRSSLTNYPSSQSNAWMDGWIHPVWNSQWNGYPIPWIELRPAYSSVVRIRAALAFLIFTFYQVSVSHKDCWLAKVWCLQMIRAVATQLKNSIRFINDISVLHALWHIDIGKMTRA